MDFKKWVKRIQTSGYNGTRTVISDGKDCTPGGDWCTNSQDCCSKNCQRVAIDLWICKL